MADTLLRRRVEAIRRLARRGATGPLARVLEKSRSEDVAAAIPNLVPAEQRMVFSLVQDEEMAAELLSRVPEPELHNLVKDMELDRLVRLLNLMEVDDETDVIGRLPPEVREQVLARIHGDDRQHVEELLSYP